MSDVKSRLEPVAREGEGREAPRRVESVAATPGKPRTLKLLGPVLVTLSALAVAAWLSWATWSVYMGAPWTRDGTVRAYVVTMAPEVAGRIVELPVADNQFVRKGDLLMVVDPTNYKIAVALGEAAVAQTKAASQNAQIESNRRQKLDDLAVSDEVKQTFASNAISAYAVYQAALANLDQARVNLERTRILAPVNGYVTNLLARLGDYVTVGENTISLVDADSFWVDGYFEEFALDRIREGAPAQIKLMGYGQIVRGHVQGIARGINIPNAQPNDQGLATVNPIFTWVRLAQRVPVRIHIDQVPDGVRLVAGLTATVQIDTDDPKPPLR
ncbi:MULTISPECIES: HlyD family secretion protein [Rhodomicrobium]|uniref:efflux RND transporter periplasmic adaptor subunit n=1 Tax=Rhodomicrobium TaxID=1068 RepID=UPI000B4A6856|nr:MULTISPECIES: HlyD family secretion protein [Rhodomicrobium]